MSLKVIAFNATLKSSDVGEPSSTDRMSYGKVAAVAVVGDEDGAHNVSAEIYQALNDVGFTIPANAEAYWVGEAMGSTNFVDLDHVPRMVTKTVKMLARNTVHLAALQERPYPGESA
jgi:predicted CoA-binding protein